MQGVSQSFISNLTKPEYQLLQGDSGGPLSAVNEKGLHVLVGIVSRRLGGTCSQDDHAMYTNVSTLLPWIKFSIKENGGMASCTFNFSTNPTLGILHKKGSLITNFKMILQV